MNYPPNAAKPHRARMGLVAGLAAVTLAGGAMSACTRPTAEPSGATTAQAASAAPGKDSGVAMCETVRDDGLNKAKTSPSPGAWTADDYRRIRGAFAQSAHADLRNSGTALADPLWQVAQLGSNNPKAFELLPQITQAYGSLVGACASHGVNIPPTIS